MTTVSAGWERIRRSLSVQFEALQDGRQLMIRVDVSTQTVLEYWIAPSFLPCPACGSFVVFHGTELVVVKGESVTFHCENDHRWTVAFQEQGEGNPPARGSGNLTR